MSVVIDDRLLLDALAGYLPARFGREESGEGLFTTGSWYYRLGRAVSAGSGSGALSGRVASFPPEVDQRVRRSLEVLPDAIGLLHPRVVVPVMFSLRVGRQLNVLSAEALAVALLTSSRLVVSTDAPLLRFAAGQFGVGYEVLT